MAISVQSNIVKQGRKRLQEDGSRNCSFKMTSDDGKKPWRSMQAITNRYMQNTVSNEYGMNIFVKKTKALKIRKRKSA